MGAGPGGVAAARRLRERAGGAIELLLFEREPAVEYLPSSVPILLGRETREHRRVRPFISGVEVRNGEVGRVSGGGVTLDGEEHEAVAVIAAPGLCLDHQQVPNLPGVHSFWSPSGAEKASAVARRFEGGTVAVVISSLPYRCPPAPFGMAMELAGFYRDEGRDVRVTLTTPETSPLAALGGGVPEFLEESCGSAGVDLVLGFKPNLETLRQGELRSIGGDTVEFDIALVIPPHSRSPLLAGLPGGEPLVGVTPDFESAEPGLFVVGDAAATQLPRAAAAAAAAGRTAADAVLTGLGLAREREAHLPEPECYVGHGRGIYSRISLRYPDGPPPEGTAAVTIEGPSRDLAAGFEEAFERWRLLRT